MNMNDTVSRFVTAVEHIQEVRDLDKTDKDQTTVKSLERALDMLTLLGRSRKPLGVAELAKVLGVNRTTLYASLNTLLSHNFIERDTETGKFTIGRRAYEIGRLYRVRFPFLGVLEQLSRNFVDRWKMEFHVGIYNGDGTVLLLINQFDVFAPTLQITDTLPAHATSLGKVLMAPMSEEEALQAMKLSGMKSYTRNTIIDPEIMLGELVKVRENGYACDRSEYIDNLMCIAAPILNADSQTLAVISVSGPQERVERNFEEVLSEVLAMSKRASREMGLM